MDCNEKALTTIELVRVITLMLEQWSSSVLIIVFKKAMFSLNCHV